MMMILALLFSLLQPASTLIAQGYSRGEPFDLEVSRLPLKSEITGNQVRLDLEAADALIDMIEFAAKSGYHIRINYGFRTHEQQIYVARQLARQGRAHLVARPGWSSHQLGLSLDISGCIVHVSNERLAKNKKLSFDVKRWHSSGACTKSRTGYWCKTELYWWLRKNAGMFGFINDVKSEPWHWTYQKLSQVEVGG